MPNRLRQAGYTLVELLVVLIILGIISAVAVRSLQKTVTVSRIEETKAEMESLAYAIAGNPSLISNGVRSDYGYVGDVGALPLTLTALTVNPGSYATWRGPYAQDKLAASVGAVSTDITQDAWGTTYTYSPSGATITSTGSGSAFTRPIANSASDLLVNQVSVSVTDLSGKSPGTTYDDSIRILLTIPNGLGGTTTKQLNPSSGGWAQFDSIPIGTHPLTVVYLSYDDTLQREVHVDPGRTYSSNIQLFRDFPGSVGGGCIGDGSIIILPSGSGAITNIPQSTGCGSHWQCVDEVIADDDGSYVTRNSNSWATDVYALTNPTHDSCPVASVIVYCRAKRDNTQGDVRLTVYMGGSEYNGTQLSLTTSWAEYSHVWATNPATGSGWTWTEIDNLQAGVRIRGQNSTFKAHCTQVWIVVVY